MKITNKLNLDNALVQAISQNRHNKKGCYSATTLLKGVKETILMERHFDEVETDCADNIWQIFGSAVHTIFENQKDDKAKKEFYFDYKVLNSTVTGKCDCFYPDDKLLIDYKTASCWKVIYKDFEDWNKQGLIYAWLLKKNGFEVNKCKFEVLLKDHSKSKAKYDENYPQYPIYIHEFEVTENDLAEIEKFIFNKVEQLEQADKLPDEQIAECTQAERWATETKFAIMRNGRKTALKLCESKEQAESLLKEIKGDYIEERKGENKRCADYCSVCQLCNFYKNNVKG